jgi:hypothetical protein
VDLAQNGGNEQREQDDEEVEGLSRLTADLPFCCPPASVKPTSNLARANVWTRPDPDSGVRDPDGWSIRDADVAAETATCGHGHDPAP